MTIAITGSTGQLGRQVIDGLKSSDTSEEIIALARSLEKAGDLGVNVRKADYDQPETLVPALSGVDTLLLISGSEVGKRVAQHKAIIDAAVSSGVKRIVYTSLLKADTSPISLAPEHVETEKLIKTSGLDYTILRNGWYTENYTGSLGGAVEAGALVGASGDGKISSATRQDYADAAVAVLTSDGHSNATYELAGDVAFTKGDMAQELSAQTSKDIPYQDISEEEYGKLLASFGLPDGLAAMLAAVDTDTKGGALYHDGNDLSSLIGRNTTPLSQAIKDALN
jgi:NAD(P)H dehydrogenase (quinone)